MAIVKGIHHVAMRCCGMEEYEKTIRFYRDVLGLPVVRSWTAGAMLSTGAGLLEIFNNGTEHPERGILEHFAFAADDVDKAVQTVRDAGFEIMIEPKDIVIPSEPPFPARIAFCRGPLGEEIELFQEK